MGDWIRYLGKKNSPHNRHITGHHSFRRGWSSRFPSGWDGLSTAIIHLGFLQFGHHQFMPFQHNKRYFPLKKKFYKLQNLKWGFLTLILGICRKTGKKWAPSHKYREVAVKSSEYSTSPSILGDSSATFGLGLTGSQSCSISYSWLSVFLLGINLKLRVGCSKWGFEHQKKWSFEP